MFRKLLTILSLIGLLLSVGAWAGSCLLRAAWVGTDPLEALTKKFGISIEHAGIAFPVETYQGAIAGRECVARAAKRGASAR